jgi:hypothetical protein
MLGKDKWYWLPVSKTLACLFYFVYHSIILTCMWTYCATKISSLIIKKIRKALWDFGFWTDICPLHSFAPLGLTLYRDY